jgi:nuclear pore complex protein Nup155
MGIIPEIHCAWIAVDERLYLWNYKDNDVTPYYGLSHQILSVALSAPKVNVFQSEVKYVLVVATTEEIVLLAVTLDAFSHTWKLIPTPYQTTTDDVIIRKIIGSQTGRIYMGGNNGSLYELEYDNVESSWGALLSDNASQPRKCVKKTHWNLGVFELIKYVFNSNSSNFGDICVDDVRNLLYVITEEGVLDMYYTGLDGNDSFSSLFNSSRIQSANIFTLAKTFVKECSSELKDLSPPEHTFDENKVVVGIYIIPLVESKDCHVMVLLKSGIRIYCDVYDTKSNVYMVLIYYISNYVAYLISLSL